MIDWSRTVDPNFREVPPKMGTMGLTLAAAAFILAFLTASDYGIASDVANYFASSMRQLSWGREFFNDVFLGQPTDTLEREAVFEAWRWNPARVPHPPLSRELSGLTWLLGHRWLDSLTAYRLAVMLSYAALTGWVAVFTHWATRSRIAGLTAGTAVLAYPALFAHGHLAHTDLFIATFWFSAAASLSVFERTRRIGWLIATGLLLGAAAATKFSGLLLVPVIVVWLAVRRPREALPAFVIVLLSSIVVFVLVNPVLWVAPEVGIMDYLRAGLDRAGDSLARLRTEYFGTIYEFRPPIHYPWVWTLIVLPPTFLAAIAVGLTTLRRHWLAAFCVLNMGVIYAALLLPRAPMHDGVRLLLPALGFQCVLVGVGAQRAIEILSDWMPRTGRSWIEALVVIAILAPAGVATVRSHPHQLSYANFLFGGPAGLAEKGLEVTNLKEALSPEVVSDLGRVIPPAAVVDAGFLTEELCFYAQQGRFEGRQIETWLPTAEGGITLTCAAEGPVPEALSRSPKDPDYVLVFNRRAVWRPMDRALWEYGGAPAYELSYDEVPLLRAYRVR